MRRVIGALCGMVVVVAASLALATPASAAKTTLTATLDCQGTLYTIDGNINSVAAHVSGSTSNVIPWGFQQTPDSPVIELSPGAWGNAAFPVTQCTLVSSSDPGQPEIWYVKITPAS